jgi:hypothetical protein
LRKRRANRYLEEAVRLRPIKEIYGFEDKRQKIIAIQLLRRFILAAKVDLMDNRVRVRLNVFFENSSN